MATIKLFNHHIRTPFLFLLFSEYALLFAMVYGGIYLRFDEVSWQPIGLESLDSLPLKAFVFASVMVLGMLAMGQYQAPSSQGRHFLPYTLMRISLSLALGVFALLVVYYIFPQILLGRGVVAYATVSVVVGLSLYRSLLYRMIDGRVLRRKILVLGAGELAFDMIKPEVENNQKAPLYQRKRLLAPIYASYVIHGFVDTGGEKLKIPEKYLVNPGDSLVDYCLEYEIDEVVLAVPDRREKVPVEELLECKLSNIEVLEYVGFWEKERGLLRTDMLNPSWLIFCDGCRQGDMESVIGRGFDIIASLIILILMSPFLFLTALLIYLENGFSGPVFYRQERVGLNGETFQLLKFRSMIVNAESNGEAQWAAKNDSRVTRVGRFIRKVRIDELPQMINILKGDMSLVGPRPERPEFVEEFKKSLPFFATRHRVKPGLAGWAQLKYPYGANEYDAMRKLQYDLYYVKNHSLIMDMLVLLQTVEVILLGKGAR